MIGVRHPGWIDINGTFYALAPAVANENPPFAAKANEDLPERPALGFKFKSFAGMRDADHGDAPRRQHRMTHRPFARVFADGMDFTPGGEIDRQQG